MILGLAPLSKLTSHIKLDQFSSLDVTSGHAQTLAALALLFAMHSFQPAPFFVLDEVDAALDSANVARAAAFIRAKTHDR